MKKITKKVLQVIVALTLVITATVGYFPTAKKAEAALSTQRVSVHDPSIIKANGKYYIFGSHRAWAQSSNLASWSTFSTNVSTDYASIFSVGRAWAAHGSSNYDISGNLWAPDVIYNKALGKYCMYMSINGNNYYSSIAMATSSSITGPYTYAGTVIYSGFINSSLASQTDYKKVMGTTSVASRYLSNGAWNAQYGPNAIDPCVRYDKNGDLWMSYGSWFGGIFMIKLDKNTGLRDYSKTYSTSTNASDQYFGYKLSGGYGCTGEGSYIVYDAETGYYYMYLSYCGLDATDSFSGYHMRLFRSSTIYGPYKDAAGNSPICTSSSTDQTSKGIKLFGNYDLSSLDGVASGELSGNGYMSPGHNSAFIDDDGQRYLVYHTRFNTGNEYHQVRVHQQFLNEDKWPVTAVYEYLGSKISTTGYSKDSIVGTYDYVNHGNSATTAYTGMLSTKKIYLNSDGTITGAVSGTWSQKSGTSYATIKIGSVTYKGVFFKQANESSSHSDTMTFTCIGSDNKAIWGSRTSSTQNPGGSSSSSISGTYYIQSKLSGLYLDIEDGSASNGANVRQWSYNGSQAQKFKIVPANAGYYYILTGASNYTGCIDVYNGSASDGTNIDQWEYWGGDMQLFSIEAVSGGYYSIKTKVSSCNSALDVYEMSTEAGANVCQWSYWGGDGQLWKLVSAS